MKRVVFLAALMMALCSPTWGYEAQRGVITTAVEGREPVDDIEIFPATDGQLSCFTRLVGAGEPTEIVHLWYWGDQLMSRVILPVKSSDWRTWSTKSFLPEWQGNWRVEVRTAEGELLKVLRFELI